MINIISQINPCNISFGQKAGQCLYSAAENIVAVREQPRFLTVPNSPVYLKVKNDRASENQFFEDFIKRGGRISKEEYDDIVKNHKSAIIKAKQMCEGLYYTDTQPEDAARISLKVSDYIKEHFPDCRIISVGTSPAVLTEQLELMGMDVIFLPFSNFRQFDIGKVDDEVMRNLSLALKFIRYKGLSNDGKVNLILDYKSSNDSGTLDNIHNIICREFSDIPNSKIQKISLADLIDFSFQNSSEFEKKRNSYFMGDVSGSTIEELTNIPHFYIVPDAHISLSEIKSTIFPNKKSESELFEKFENFSRPLARAFSLCSFNEIQKRQNYI